MYSYNVQVIKMGIVECYFHISGTDVDSDGDIDHRSFEYLGVEGNSITYNKKINDQRLIQNRAFGDRSPPS